jgi:hypothetical protein
VSAFNVREKAFELFPVNKHGAGSYPADLAVNEQFVRFATVALELQRAAVLVVHFLGTQKRLQQGH